MKLSEEGFKFIAREEAVRTKVYQDAAGKPTIGIGHLLTPDEVESGVLVIEGEEIPYQGGITEEQAYALFRQDLARFEKAVNDSVEVPLKQNQFDTLVSFCFNVGAGRPGGAGKKPLGFRGSTLLRLLNQGDYDAVPGELAKWTISGGRRVKGLVRRRAREAAVWQKADYRCEPE